MSEDAYQPNAPLHFDIFRSGHCAGKTLYMKQRIKLAALNSPTGIVNVCRKDKESGEWITDEITADMPLDEIIL